MLDPEQGLLEEEGAPVEGPASAEPGDLRVDGDEAVEPEVAGEGGVVDGGVAGGAAVEVDDAGEAPRAGVEQEVVRAEVGVDDGGAERGVARVPEEIVEVPGDGVAGVGAHVAEEAGDAVCFIAELDGVPIGEGWLQTMYRQRILDEFRGRDVRRIDLTMSWWAARRPGARRS